MATDKHSGLPTLEQYQRHSALPLQEPDQQKASKPKWPQRAQLLPYLPSRGAPWDPKTVRNGSLWPLWLLAANALFAAHTPRSVSLVILCLLPPHPIVWLHSPPGSCEKPTQSRLSGAMRLLFIDTFRVATTAVPAGGTIIYGQRPDGKLFTLYAGWACRHKKLSNGGHQILSFFCSPVTSLAYSRSLQMARWMA